jgi:hypothetical protein
MLEAPPAEADGALARMRCRRQTYALRLDDVDAAFSGAVHLPRLAGRGSDGRELNRPLLRGETLTPEALRRRWARLL